jgi:hypothetical protein
VSKKKKASPEFVPKVIEDDGGDEPNLFAFIPHQIEADWDDKYGPLLEGFPLNILYGGITTDARTKKQSIVDVCYWPAPATFHEHSERKEMCYFPNLANDYFVRVIFEKRMNEWQTEKYKGDTLVRSAFGPTFDKVMINTTMGGPEPDER